MSFLYKKRPNWLAFSGRSTPQTFFRGKGKNACVIFFVLSLVWLSGCGTPGNPEGSPPDHRHPGFTRLLNSVVRIDVREATYESGNKRFRRGVGSGVILDPDGLILTNAHVVSPHAEEILVTLPSLERVAAQFVGWDHWTDLALIKLDMEKVNERRLQFNHAEFGDSGLIKPGQEVYAVGTPNGLTRTVTRGIVSNPNRYFAASNQIRGYETGYFNTWLQTDAAINPGNSGGPLVLPDGRVIGINTRSYLGADNLSFAVPVNIALEVIPGLTEKGAIDRSYIGIKPAPLQDLESFFGLEANRGMLIESVDPGSPADRAGLTPGDILLSLNGSPLDGRFPEQLPGILHLIAETPVGDEITFTVRNEGSPKTVSIATERLESRVGDRKAFAEWGLSVQEVSKPIARERQFDSDNGVLVIGVQSAFPAEEAGLRRGDIILSANRRNIEGLDDLQSVYNEFLKAPDRVLLEVNRNHRISYVVLKSRY